MANGFTQTFRINYRESFAPVAKINSILIMLSLIAIKNWELHLLDGKNIFLHGDLHEEVFMDIFARLQVSIQGERTIYVFKKLSYGLKQFLRVWYSKISNRLTSEGFKMCGIDNFIFIYIGKGNWPFLWMISF